jgi:hypothetical protein
LKFNNSKAGGMTIATTTFLKLNQSHFNQGDYIPTPSQPIVSESGDFYHQHHHFPYHFVAHHQYYPHMHCDHHNAYGTTSGGGGGGGNSAKTHGHHTYQTIGPSTISSSVFPEHHYAKPDNMGNIEIIDSKKSPNFDEMNNEL